MPQKVKFIIFGLAAILLISLFFNLQIYNSKQNLLKEKDSLLKENGTLNKKVEENLRENKRLEEQLSVLNQDLEKFSREKEDLQKRYDLLKEERENLIQKLKEQAEAMAKQTQPNQEQQGNQTAAAPRTEDPFWANLLKTKADLELQLSDTRKALNAVKLENDQIKRERGSLDLEISNLNAENEDLKRQLEYNQKVVDSVTKELVIEKNDKFDVQNTYKSLKSENSVLRQQLKGLLTNKASLERKLTELQVKYDDLQNNLSKMDTLLKDKMIQVDALSKNIGQIAKPESPEEKRDSVILPPIVVRPSKEGLQQQQRTSPVLNEGKVMLINRDNNFVIINLGEDAGVRQGDKFQIYRENELVAHVEVIQTRANISACDIKKELTPIKVGDAVR